MKIYYYILKYFMHTPLATECIYNVSLLFRPDRSLVLLCQTPTITVSTRVLYNIIINNNNNNIQNYIIQLLLPITPHCRLI